MRATAPAAELSVYGLAILTDPAPAGSLALHSLPVRLQGVVQELDPELAASFVAPLF